MCHLGCKGCKGERKSDENEIVEVIVNLNFQVGEECGELMTKTMTMTMTKELG